MAEQNVLSTHVVSKEDAVMFEKAEEIVALFKTASELGFSVCFTPEQLKTLIAICEEGHLYKRDK